ncbi:hypothetical protein GF351_03045 [Candidatus Woesearchaeota archaeon]|nr:hypothetical protein [Candidatus Woesearchaeota archaeon]
MEGTLMKKSMLGILTAVILILNTAIVLAAAPNIALIPDKTVEENSTVQDNWIDLQQFKFDGDTNLYCSWDNSTNCTGLVPNPAKGGVFPLEAGVYGSSVRLQQPNWLTYHTDNYNIDEGTIEMWIKPNFDMTDTLNNQGKMIWYHDSSSDSYNQFYVTIRNMKLMLASRRGSESLWQVAHTDVSHWNKDEWNHVAASWGQEAGIYFLRIYANGALSGEYLSAEPIFPENKCPHLFSLSSKIHCNKENLMGEAFDGWKDEFRLSSAAREDFTQVFDDGGLSNLAFTITGQTDPGLINCSIVGNRYVNCTDPAAGQTGFSDITVNATDAEGLSDAYTFRININSTLEDTEAPVIGVIPANGSTVSRREGTTDRKVYVMTDEPASCERSDDPAFAFGTGTPIPGDDGQKHIFTYNISEDDNNFTFYYRCNDTEGNVNAGSFYHLFYVSDTAVNGTVTDSSANPLENVTVSLYDSADTLVGQANTDSLGHYLKQLAQGVYTAVFSKAGYSSHNETGVSVAWDSVTTVDVNMLSLWATITGRVFDNDNTIYGADVELKQGGTVMYSASSNTTGGYVVNLLSGDYNLTVSKQGFNTTVVALSLAPEDNQTADVTLVPDTNGTVTGTVFDWSFAKIANASVHLYDGGTLVQVVESDDQGDYIINGAYDNTDYYVNGTKAGFTASTTNGPFVVAGNTVGDKDILLG